MAERKGRRWLYGVEPIDFEALERGAWRSYWRPTVEQLAEHKKARAEAIKRRREKRMAEAKARAPRSEWKRRTPFEWGGPSLAARIAAVMADGGWYARPDILRLSGLGYGSVKMTTQRMWRRGEVERARNPDYRPAPYRKGVPIHKVLDRPPLWLYRLTAEGRRLLDGQ